MSTKPLPKTEIELIDGIRVFKWDEAAQLPIEKKHELGSKVTNVLATHTSTMLQYTSQEIVEIIDDRRAVVVVQGSDQEFRGFAQISQWPKEPQSVPAAIEFRSWLSTGEPRGIGSLTLRHAVALSSLRFPEVPAYAVVEANNDRAKQVLIAEGALSVPMPDAIDIILMDGDGQAAVETFDLSGVTPEF